MSHVLNYHGQYFRVEITEVARADDPDQTMYVGWCSEAFKELKNTPRQTLSRFVAGPPLPTQAEALRHAYEWIKINWDTELTKRAQQGTKVGDPASIVYTVWLFKGDGSVGFDFEEFADAKNFAKAAEQCLSMTKIGITNNESPQYLTVWDRG